MSQGSIKLVGGIAALFAAAVGVGGGAAWWQHRNDAAETFSTEVAAAPAAIVKPARAEAVALPAPVQVAAARPVAGPQPVLAVAPRTVQVAAPTAGNVRVLRAPTPRPARTANQGGGGGGAQQASADDDGESMAFEEESGIFLVGSGDLVLTDAEMEPLTEQFEAMQSRAIYSFVTPTAEGGEAIEIKGVLMFSNGNVLVQDSTSGLAEPGTAAIPAVSLPVEGSVDEFRIYNVPQALQWQAMPQDEVDAE